MLPVLFPEFLLFPELSQPEVLPVSQQLEPVYYLQVHCLRRKNRANSCSFNACPAVPEKHGNRDQKKSNNRRIRMKKYSTVNNLMGWITFLIAATVYCMTIEPTASFWDCPEFITTGYKLEVGHPPGAPFFMLVANLFSQFAADASEVAKMVNYMSALMSAACILFLFWTITHLVRKLIVSDETHITAGQTVAIMGSGLVGALAYTFSDTFWFSAVEGEVYAFSSLFTAVVFWLILKWEDVADQPHSDRWLVLLSIIIRKCPMPTPRALCWHCWVRPYWWPWCSTASCRAS